MIAFGERGRRPTAVGCRRVPEKIAWSGGALQQFDSLAMLCYARYLPTSSYRRPLPNFYRCSLAYIDTLAFGFVFNAFWARLVTIGRQRHTTIRLFNRQRNAVTVWPFIKS